MKKFKDFNFGKFIIGVDEVGRGCLAGPVIACAITLDIKNFPDGINDSKKLNKKKRNYLYKKLIDKCNYALGIASVKEIDRFNIHQSSLLAMKRALNKLETLNHIILVDGKFSPISNNKNIQCIIKGDQQCISIAAASIIAKVTRDNLMAKLGTKFTYYDWNNNVGYGTKKHLDGIQKFGICIHHRKTFAPIHNLL